MLAADKASLDAALGVFTATSALLASKWVGNSLVLVAKEVDQGASDVLDISSWHVHPLLKVRCGMLDNMDGGHGTNDDDGGTTTACTASASASQERGECFGATKHHHHRIEKVCGVCVCN